jgi:hypothetical protein
VAERVGVVYGRCVVVVVVVCWPDCCVALFVYISRRSAVLHRAGLTARASERLSDYAAPTLLAIYTHARACDPHI